MKLTVTEVIEKDEDRVLFAGWDKKHRKKTFHLMRDEGGQVDRMVELVEAGEHVEVEA